MSGRKYYCFCDSNCKFETMTKEQILAAIAQAAETGLTIDEDAAFITKVKEMNAGGMVSFWVGTQAQYNALESVDKSCVYIITDSKKEEELQAKLQEIKSIAEERPQAVLLWENTDIPESGSGGGQEALPASEDATFAAQTLELDLSNYSTVLIQFSINSIEVFDSGKWVYEPAVIEKVCAVGSGKYSTVSNMSSGEGATRHFRVDKDGISFLSAEEFSYANPGVSNTNNNTLIPCKIFGL